MKALLTLPSIVFLAAPLIAFTPPRNPARLKAEYTTERLETVDLPRIRIDANPDIQMDFLEAFTLTDAKDESLLLTHRYRPNLQISLSVWPETSIRGDIDQANVQDYVRRLSENAARNQEHFEVITPPTDDSAPTKIRFLGAKPITLEYIVVRSVNGESTRVMVQESWVQLNEQVYLLRVEAPEDRFNDFFRQCKGLASSMYFVE